MIAFGPIPSRRLGNSLGVNNIPPKHCSYSCIYCQAGRTPRTDTVRQAFHGGENVVRAVARRAIDCWKAGRPIDHITFVPDGEPTLDQDLGLEIRGAKALGHPVAVLTNGSLLSRPDVRADLAAADLVSVKVDAADETVWRRIDVPCLRLRFQDVLAGVAEFARHYRGRLTTETMLVHGVNDDPASVGRIAGFLSRLAPRIAYLAVPTRPPADSRVRAPRSDVLKGALAIFRERLPKVELLSGEEPGSYAPTTDAIDDLLAILAVHPMRMQEVDGFLDLAGLGHDTVDRLVHDGRAQLVRHRRQTFLVGPHGDFTERVETP